MDPAPTHTLRDGVRAAVPVIVPTFALAASFGVLARPVMGVVAPIVMSIVVFAGGAQFAALSTVAGVLASSAIPDPDALGLDAIFPAFYLVLLVGEIRSGRIVLAVALAAAITLSLMSFAPPGVPVVAASAAALLGLWRREARQAA